MKNGNKLIACGAMLFISAAAVITSGLIAEKRSAAVPAVEIVEISRAETVYTAEESAEVTEVTEAIAATAAPVKRAGKININTAAAEELTELDGIGEKTAAAIIEYRGETPFQSAEDIMNVKGIGEKKFEAIKDMICV